jgi:hypothetical protein
MELDFSRSLAVWFKFDLRCINLCVHFLQFYAFSALHPLTFLIADIEWKKLLCSYQFIEPIDIV